MGKKCFYIHCNLSLIFHYQFFRISPGLAPKFIWQNSVRYDCDTNPHTSATSSSGKSVCVSRFFTLSFRSPFSHSWGVVRNSSRNSRRKVLRLYPQRSARCPVFFAFMQCFVTFSTSLLFFTIPRYTSACNNSSPVISFIFARAIGISSSVAPFGNSSLLVQCGRFRFICCTYCASRLYTPFRYPRSG